MHKTKQGETWDIISIKYYDTPFRVTQLISANPQYSDVLIFSEGIEIVIPEIATETINSLPPWKRGKSI